MILFNLAAKDTMRDYFCFPEPEPEVEPEAEPEPEPEPGAGLHGPQRRIFPPSSA